MRKIYLLGLLYVGLSVVYMMRVREPAAVPPDDAASTVMVQPRPAFDPDDGWRRTAIKMIEEIEAR